MSKRSEANFEMLPVAINIYNETLVCSPILFIVYQYDIIYYKTISARSIQMSFKYVCIGIFYIMYIPMG